MGGGARIPRRIVENRTAYAAGIRRQSEGWVAIPRGFSGVGGPTAGGNGRSDGGGGKMETTVRQPPRRQRGSTEISPARYAAVSAGLRSGTGRRGSGPARGAHARRHGGGRHSRPRGRRLRPVRNG